MLSDQERSALREVQRQLATEDPDLAASFDELGHGWSRFPLDWVGMAPRWAFTTVAAAATALSVLMVLADGMGTALLFVVLAATAVGARWHRTASHQRQR